MYENSFDKIITTFIFSKLNVDLKGRGQGKVVAPPMEKQKVERIFLTWLTIMLQTMRIVIRRE